MRSENRDPVVDREAADTGWQGLYKAAGVGTLIAVAFMLLDIGLSFAGGDVEVGGLSAVDWFAHLRNSWFLGLRNLGLFNVINPLLTIPLYLALYQTHRKAAPALAALVLIFYIMGAAIYIANNQALTMLALSDRYAQASTEAQKALLAAAGTVILSQAEDFTPGSFPRLFLSSAASAGMMVVLLRGRVFSRWIALAGLVGAGCLLFFTISATFAPAIFQLAMLLALAGGLLMVAWNIVMALGMFRLGRAASQPGERRNVTTRLPA